MNDQDRINEFTKSILRSDAPHSTKIKTPAIDTSLHESPKPEVSSKVLQQVSNNVADYLSQMDLASLVSAHVRHAAVQHIKEFSFPPTSIPAAAIDFSGYTLNGNNVSGGLIASFGSTGIQDGASACQVTIMDNATIVENTLVAAALDIKGDVTIEGELNLTGELSPESPFLRDVAEHAAGILKLSLDDSFFNPYIVQAVKEIIEGGLDLELLKLNGHEVMKGNQLGTTITESNLQLLGELKELIVKGEVSLTNTLYVGHKRVGINTTEPAGAFAVWDEECEIVMRKLRSDTSIIGSTRSQKVVLSSNGKSNIVLDVEGNVSIERLTVGKVTMQSAKEVPSTNVARGIIMWNENPEVGSPMGWVSLGNSRWAKFGEIY